MFLYKQPVKTGTPWHDYKEAEKSGREVFFVFRIEDYLSFVLREVCITWPAVAVSGRSQLPLKVKIEIASSQNQFIPREIPPELFSSPNQNFNLGALNEDPQGIRLNPFIFNYPCDYGDVITITVSGDTTGINIGCMIHGRKYEGGK